MNWMLILLVVAVLFILFKLIHFRHFKQKVVVVFVVLLLLFLVLTFSSVVQNNNINLKSPTGLAVAGKVYLSWFGSVFDNLKVITGNIIRMDWIPKDMTPK